MEAWPSDAMANSHYGVFIRQDMRLEWISADHEQNQEVARLCPRDVQGSSLLPAPLAQFDRLQTPSMKELPFHDHAGIYCPSNKNCVFRAQADAARETTDYYTCVGHYSFTIHRRPST